MAEWQPIETVPDMQTVILFAYSSDITSSVMTWKIATGYAFGDEFVWDGRSVGPHELKPTHWMPLPEPPK